jgi:3-dehydroquinate dehydratase/shikimate dehydrogenase
LANLPFYIVTLTHPTWDEALACAKRLGEDALPELRLDLFPDLDPEAMVDALKHRCLVSCRRVSEGGQWPDEDEAGRIAQLVTALRGRPVWMDLEWDLELPPLIQEARTYLRLLRSVHVPRGVFDLDERLEHLPEGDAYKWVGWAERLGDSGRLRQPLAWAKDHGIHLAAFLMGAKGLVSRVMGAAWGGAFAYTAPDDGPAAAPGQLPLATMRAWRAARLNPGHGLCGVIGDPVLHSRGPAFHNPRFQAAFKDLVYLPLTCGDPGEGTEALDALGILGLSITAPLKVSLPAALGLEGPLNTLWRRAPGAPWHGANTDAEALRQNLSKLQPGPILILGDGGVAATTRKVLEETGHPHFHVSRKHPSTPEAVAAFAPVGAVQATSLGMDANDPPPFADLLEAARPSLCWAMEWIYKEDTAFSRWVVASGLTLVPGADLFRDQAEGQSRRFIEGCGGDL